MPNPIDEMITIAKRAAERAGAEIVFVGAIPARIWGSQMPTRDVDLLVAEQDAESLLAALALEPLEKPEFSVTRGLFSVSRYTFLFHGRQFFLDVLHGEHAYLRQVIDRSIILTDTPYGSMRVAAPEDVVIMKLISSRDPSRELKDLFAVMDIIRVSGDGINWQYLREHVSHFNLSDQLERVMKQIRKIEKQELSE